jgi:hypothetical protein
MNKNGVLEFKKGQKRMNTLPLTMTKKRKTTPNHALAQTIIDQYKSKTVEDMQIYMSLNAVV